MKFVIRFFVVISFFVSIDVYSYEPRDFFDRPAREFPEREGFGLSSSLSTGYSSNVTQLETGVSSSQKGISISSGYAFQGKGGRYLAFSVGRSKTAESAGDLYDKYGYSYQLDAGLSINSRSKLRVEFSSQSWTEALNKNNFLFNEKGDQVVIDYFSFNYNLGRSDSVGFLNLFYENKIQRYNNNLYSGSLLSEQERSESAFGGYFRYKYHQKTYFDASFEQRVFDYNVMLDSSNDQYKALLGMGHSLTPAMDILFMAGVVSKNYKTHKVSGLSMAFDVSWRLTSSLMTSMRVYQNVDEFSTGGESHKRGVVLNFNNYYSSRLFVRGKASYSLEEAKGLDSFRYSYNVESIYKYNRYTDMLVGFRLGRNGISRVGNPFNMTGVFFSVNYSPVGGES